jgi:formamidopyrimidine-DNA glycosylase
MPELPEVESVVRALRPLVAGRRIRRCRVVLAIAVRPSSPLALSRRLAGQRIRAVKRRGKYVLLRLDRGWVILHFRLDGQLLWADDRGIPGHVDVVLELDRGALGFVDRRHFGRVQWALRPEDVAGIASLGVEPLGKEFSLRWLADSLRQSRSPLKLWLLDQTHIAGLGNIYSSEALWRARLDPRRKAGSVTPAESRRLHKAIVGVLRAALECCLDPAPDFRDPDWWFSGLDRVLAVYDREGRGCRRCGARIRRISQGGRSTYFCPGCQH